MIDVVMPQYLTTDLTKRAVDALNEHTSEYRLILVDDGTPDHKIDQLNLPKATTIILHESNQGYVAAIRTGLKHAHADFVVTMNNDVVVTPGWLNKLISAMSTSRKIANVSPVMTQISGICNVTRIGAEVGYNPIDDPDVFFNRLPETVVTPASGNIPDICMLWNRRVLLKIGGYCPDFFAWGADDDLNDRMRAAGYTPAVCVNCFVHHNHGATWKRVPNRLDVLRAKDQTLLRTRRKQRAERSV